MDGEIGSTSIPGGSWAFHLYCYASSLTGTNEILPVVYRHRLEAGTLTITGTGTSRTATVTGGTPFVAGDANASMELCGWITTPNAQMRITAFTSSSVVTIECLSTYTNESAVAYYKDLYLLSSTTGDIQSTTVTEIVVPPIFTNAFVVLATDKIIHRMFARTNSAVNRTISVVYGGSTNYTHFHSPLTARHDSLAKLDWTSSGHTGTINTLAGFNGA